MNEWIDRLQAIRNDYTEVMLVTIASVRGSAPREVGARMIVTDEESIGSIGGGQLEYQCTRIAVEYLRDYPASTRFWRRFPLGAELGQCCGGVVEVLFERFLHRECGWFDELQRLFEASEPVIMVTSSDNRFLVTADSVFAGNESRILDELVAEARSMLDEQVDSARCAEIGGERILFEPIVDSGMQVAIFGAGHVGSACVAALSKIDCRIRWIDNRRNIFPDVMPPQVTRVDSRHPALEVAAMPAGAYYLVMTHSHPLDYDICQQILMRDDFSYCGLIGSVTKRRRFEKLMRECDLPDALLQKLSCPIGLAGIRGKKPDEIAISVTAQLLGIRDAARSEKGNESGQPLLVVAKANRQTK